MTLTKKDIKQIDEKITSRLEAGLAQQKDEIEEMFTEFRDDFYTKIDPILKEVTTNRDEREIINGKLSDHEDRITKVETKLSAN